MEPRMSTLSCVMPSIHFSRSALTGHPRRCSFNRACRCFADIAHTSQSEHLILYTIPLLRNFSTGSFSDGSKVFNFLRVKITLHCTVGYTCSKTLTCTIVSDVSCIRFAAFPLYWRSMKGFSAISSSSSCHG